MITLLYRKANLNFSIERVFDTVFNELKKTNNINKISVPCAKITFLDIIKNLLFCSNIKSDIIHITGDIHYCSLFLLNKKIILTIHDTVLIDNYRGLKRFFIYLFWYYMPILKCKKITCISLETYDKLVKYFPWGKDKFHVIHNPVDPQFKYSFKEFNASKPRILHIGTRENKNLDRVISALKNINCHLRIIGKLNVKQRSQLLASKIDFSATENIDNEEIVQEYIQSDIVSFPSTYEGFGMPIIEAQAIGRVVLTSNLKPMTEVASDAALFVDPYDVVSIKEGFLSLITNSEQRNLLISLGQLNVNKFKVENICKQYEGIYYDV